MVGVMPWMKVEGLCLFGVCYEGRLGIYLEAGSRIGHRSMGKDSSGYHEAMIMKWK